MITVKQFADKHAVTTARIRQFIAENRIAGARKLGRDWFIPNRAVIRPPANATAVWEIESKIEDSPGNLHPTMKPVVLIRRPILYHTKPGGLIYEPFSGSGTAIIAAENTGRTCFAMEQSPAFVDAAVARWEAYVGEEATLEGDGRSFADVNAERLP